jgi:hypothetical protein
MLGSFAAQYTGSDTPDAYNVLMRFRLRTLLILLAILPPVLAAIGISVFHLRQKPPTASGTVTLRGIPLTNGTVEFVAESDDRRTYAAKTDAQGRYRLNGSQTSPPLKPGRYRVTIAVPGKPQQLKTELITDLHPNAENEIHFDLQ